MKPDRTFVLYLGLLLQCFPEGTSLTSDLCQCPEANEFNVIRIANVTENAPLNSVIKKLRFEGGSRVEVKAVASNPYVAFDETTYEFKIAKKLEVSQHNPLILNDISLSCTILQNDQKINYQVLIDIHDTNNHLPVFVNQPYVFNISELTPPGIALTPDITVTDLDPRDSGLLTFSIIYDNPYAEFFNFTIPSKGRLILQRQLNYQEVKLISLRIQVKDNSYNYSLLGTYQPQHIATTTATINVLSIFADMPAFLKQSYTLDLADDYDVSKAITVDPSWRSHGVDGYTFSLVQDPNMDDWQFFTIEGSVGELKARKELSLPQYLLQIQVRKSSKSLFGTSLVVVRRPPRVRFAQKTFKTSLPFSTPANSQVALLQLNNNLMRCDTSSYAFKTDESDQNSKYFRITKEGRVILTKNLTPSLPRTFKLQLSLFSNSKLVDTAHLHVDVTQAKPSRTRFAKEIYDFEFYNSTYIGKVEVISQFTESLLSYNLISRNKGLTIDNHGVLSCQGGGCWSSPQPVMATLYTNNTLQDSTLIILNPTKLPETSNLKSASVDYKAAFIVSIIIACLLLLVILSFATFACLLYQKRAEQFEEHFNNISTTFSEESTDPFAHNRKLSRLDKLQGILVNEANDLANRNEQTVSGEEQIETPNTQTIKMDQNSANSVNNPKNIALQKDLASANLSDSSIMARSDVNISQDTINASIMTLTRPAVGTNGITVYY